MQLVHENQSKSSLSNELQSNRLKRDMISMITMKNPHPPAPSPKWGEGEPEQKAKSPAPSPHLGEGWGEGHPRCPMLN
jgi:hypothetical protein